MKKEYNLSDGIKNPFAGKFNDGYKIVVHHKSQNNKWDETINVSAAEVEEAKANRKKYRETLTAAENAI